MGKPSLAIVIGGKSSGDDDGGDEHDAAASELADTIGIPKDKMGAFKEALRGYVEMCVADAMKDGKDDDGGDEEGGY